MINALIWGNVSYYLSSAFCLERESVFITVVNLKWIWYTKFLIIVFLQCEPCSILSGRHIIVREISNFSVNVALIFGYLATNPHHQDFSGRLSLKNGSFLPSRSRIFLTIRSVQNPSTHFHTPVNKILFFFFHHDQLYILVSQ